MTAAPKPLRPVVLEDYREWVRWHPCCACWPMVLPADRVQLGQRRRQSAAAHVLSRGSGASDEANLLPLCHWHHIMIQHVRGWGSLWAAYPDDPALPVDQRGRPALEHAQWLATRYWEAYRSWRAREPTPVVPAW